MIIKNYLSVKVIFYFIFFLSINFANADITEPSGGDYNTDKQARNEARAYIEAFDPVQLLDYFMCIGTNLSENYPNSAWKTLTDNTACMQRSGLARPSNDKNATTPQIAENLYSSTRASNSAEQVILSYGTNSDGHALLGKNTILTAPDTTNPNGTQSLIYDVIEPASGHTLGDAKGMYNISSNSDRSSLPCSSRYFCLC